jgi:hypothetical protein
MEEFFRDTGYDVSSPSLNDDSEVDGRSNGEPNLFLGSQTLDTRLSDALRKNDNTKIWQVTVFGRIRNELKERFSLYFPHTMPPVASHPELILSGTKCR